MTATIPAHLAPIRATLAAATRGPWEEKTDCREKPSVWKDEEYAFPIGMCADHNCEAVYEEADAVFIASAPTTVARLLAAVESVVELAEKWEARGEHDMAYSKTIPDEDIAMELLTHGADMVEKARIIRTALTDALGDER